MIGYILTPQEYTQVQGQFYTEDQFFNCVSDINSVWYLFLSTQDKKDILNSSWNWILALPEKEYVPPLAQPFPPVV